MIMIDKVCLHTVGGIAVVHLNINGEWFEINRGYTKKEWYLFELILKEYFNGKS